jgi:5-carboxymethyl-2-hydroxymuconate isomerase
MPHVTVEYTQNLRDQAAIPLLLERINQTLMAQAGVFPLGGIRSRAIELADYRIADGAGDYAFVHTSFRIGAGRSDAVKRAACEALFQTIKDHFASLFDQRPLALSMEFAETDEAWSWKHNNLHALLRASR